MRFPHLVLIASLAAACATPYQPKVRALGDVLLTVDGDVADLGETITGLVPANATLAGLLRQAAVPADLTASLVQAVAGVFNPRDLRVDQPYRITRTLNGLFREFRYEIDTDNVLQVIFHDASATEPASFDASVVPLAKEYELAVATASVEAGHSSFVDAFMSSGENIQLPLQLAEIFGGELDFNADLRRGDRVDALFERATRDGEFIGYGDVKAAVLKSGSRRIVAIEYTPDGGKAGWYDEQGRSLRREFLKSPLPFDPRVTSGFSFNRMNPVLGIERAHLGVDFGAPYGTAVKAVAAGTIELAAWAGEAGRMVKIKHAGGYETAYLHLSSFGPGIHPGARVDQGQLIGRVGQTGLATGPHLDYRVIRRGVYVNPLTEFSRTPPGDPIPASALADFGKVRDDAMSELRKRLAAIGADAAAVDPQPAHH